MNNIEIEQIVKQVLAGMQGTEVAKAPKAAGEVPSKCRAAVLTDIEKIELKEYPIPELGDDDILVKVDCFKVAAILEQVVVYFVYCSRKSYALEVCAGVECVWLDGCHAVWNYDVCNLLAFEECSFANACYAVGLVVVTYGRGNYYAVRICSFG